MWKGKHNQQTSGDKISQASTYTKIGNVYANSPDLSNLDYETTYYMTCSSDLSNLEVYGRIDRVEAPSDWYDYSDSSKKWANITTVANQSTTYWVWIPRYKYKIENGTPLIEFVDINDVCKDSDGNIKTLSDDYQMPESFTFNGKELSGIWVSKYEITDRGMDDIRISALENTISIVKNLQGEEEYSIWLDGVKTYTGTLPYTIENVQQNKEYNVFVTKSNEVLGNVKVQTPSIKVAIDDLNKSKTYYIVYDENGNNPKIAGRMDKMAPPSDWYDYGKKIWANIVTIGGEEVAYWTYIPRYAYTLPYTGGSLVMIQFVPSTQTNVEGALYQIPESFTFDGKELDGIWVSKYEVSNSRVTEISQVFNADGTMTLNTSSASTVYDVWVDGELLLDDVTFPQTISAENVKLDIMVAKNNAEIVYTRDSSQNALPIEVDISNIQKDISYYVLYDKTGQDPQEVSMTEDLETAIQRISAEKGKEYVWYDYGRKIWANIVTKGKDSAGKESIAYWTYIPRYAYDTTNYSVQNIVGIQFVSKDIKNGDKGFVVPESFTFAGKELPGIWVSKYEVSAAP